LLQLLQDNLSGWRQTAGSVLAYREKLDDQIIQKIRALRDDNRPWVRMAAWDALVRIQEVRDEREKAAKENAQKPAEASSRNSRSAAL
jgi:hypothetical protein